MSIDLAVVGRSVKRLGLERFVAAVQASTVCSALAATGEEGAISTGVSVRDASAS